MATVAVAKGVVTVTGKKAGRTTITVTRNGASEKTNVEVETTGWKLVPVVVAAKDLAEGTIVTAADLEQRDVPEFMVTTTVALSSARAMTSCDARWRGHLNSRGGLGGTERRWDAGSRSTANTGTPRWMPSSRPCGSPSGGPG